MLFKKSSIDENQKVQVLKKDQKILILEKNQFLT